MLSVPPSLGKTSSNSAGIFMECRPAENLVSSVALSPHMQAVSCVDLLKYSDFDCVFTLAACIAFAAG